MTFFWSLALTNLTLFSFSELKEKRDELVRKKSEQQVQGGQVETA